MELRGGADRDPVGQAEAGQSPTTAGGARGRPQAASRPAKDSAPPSFGDNFRLKLKCTGDSASRLPAGLAHSPPMARAARAGPGRRQELRPGSPRGCQAWAASTCLGCVHPPGRRPPAWAASTCLGSRPPGQRPPAWAVSTHLGSVHPPGLRPPAWVHGRLQARWAPGSPHYKRGRRRASRPRPLTQSPVGPQQVLQQVRALASSKESGDVVATEDWGRSAAPARRGPHLG